LQPRGEGTAFRLTEAGLGTATGVASARRVRDLVLARSQALRSLVLELHGGGRFSATGVVALGPFPIRGALEGRVAMRDARVIEIAELEIRAGLFGVPSGAKRALLEAANPLLDLGRLPDLPMTLELRELVTGDDRLRLEAAVRVLRRVVRVQTW